MKAARVQLRPVQFPAVVQTERGPVKTKLSGWRGLLLKTQYSRSKLRWRAQLPAMPPHRHRPARQAKELGCLAEVSDEGGFWQKRDFKALVQEIGSWNEMIAAFGGKLKACWAMDHWGSSQPSPNTRTSSNWKRRARTNCRPDTRSSFRLIGRVGREVSATCA